MTDRDENAEPRIDGGNGPVVPRGPGKANRLSRADARTREHRRRRLRRHGRRAYIRSVYFLPSLCTLGNAISGFGAIYVASLDDRDAVTLDVVTQFFAKHHFVAAAYLIFLAMLFDALDGRLARFARHTTDFGGQLDSLADVISFGVAPAFIMIEVFKAYHPAGVAPLLSRLIWSIGALYMSCAAMRLARFNVSNEHGEQHHFSFLGLPSPGAGGTVAAVVLMQQEIAQTFGPGGVINTIGVWLLPLVVLMTGLLMISNIRYPHMVNRYMRGKKSIGMLLLVVTIVLLFVVAHRYVLALAMLVYSLSGLTSSGYLRYRRKVVRPQVAQPANS